MWDYSSSTQKLIKNYPHNCFLYNILFNPLTDIIYVATGFCLSIFPSCSDKYTIAIWHLNEIASKGYITGHTDHVS